MPPPPQNGGLPSLPGGLGLANLPIIGGLFGGNSGNIGANSGVFGGLGGIFSKLADQNLEIEDYLIIGVLYLLYRETKDIEFLIIAGLMFIL
jgi:hypothetical protein